MCRISKKNKIRPRESDEDSTSDDINTHDEMKQYHRSFLKLLAANESKSLLRKHLDWNMIPNLLMTRTKFGATLMDCIRSGVQNLDAVVGIYAADPECYKVFSDLFDPIIQDYHGFGPNDKQPDVDLGESRTKELEPLDPEGKYIISTQIRCARSLDGHPFNPLLSAEDYLAIQKKVKSAVKKGFFSKFFQDKDLKGSYYPLEGMKKETQKKLIADGFLFKNDDRHLQHANAYRHWPSGRGIFYNKEKSFIVWVNEEDHLRLISMQNGSDVGKVYDRLIRGVKNIEKFIRFARDPHLGYLTFCPTNLGSTIRASVHIKLPKVAARQDFKDICDKLNLQVRGIHGQRYVEGEEGVMDISNKQCLGISEYQAVCQMYHGVKKLIKMEKESE